MSWISRWMYSFGCGQEHADTALFASATTRQPCSGHFNSKIRKQQTSIGHIVPRSLPVIGKKLSLRLKGFIKQFSINITSNNTGNKFQFKKGAWPLQKNFGWGTWDVEVVSVNWSLYAENGGSSLASHFWKWPIFIPEKRKIHKKKKVAAWNSIWTRTQRLMWNLGQN